LENTYLKLDADGKTFSKPRYLLEAVGGGGDNRKNWDKYWIKDKTVMAA
jgi:hypothetical protein